MRNDRALIHRATGVGLLMAALYLPCTNAQQALEVWPEVPTVQQWLAEELRASRQLLKVPEHNSSSKLREAPLVAKPPAVELIAVYGTPQSWAVDVRIGGKVHVLRSSGPDRADDARGQDSIVADRREGACLRLRYRSTSRRLCLSQSSQEG